MSTFRFARLLPPVLLAASSFSLAACGDDNGAGTGPSAGAAPVAFSVGTTGGTALPPAVAATVNDPSSVMLTDAAGDTLVITRVRMVFAEVELEQAGGAGCTGTQRDDDDDCEELDIGPRLVDLPLGSGPLQQIGFRIPAGLYDEFEFEIDDVDDDTPAQRDFRAANPEFRDVSIRVEGRWRGQPFTWAAKVDKEFEYEFEPALRIEDGVNDNVTIEVDLGRWFRGANGRLIAPTLANQSLLTSNIETALGAYADRDRDGRRDDGRSNGRGRGRDDTR
jgi:hypothetical protein